MKLTLIFMVYLEALHFHISEIDQMQPGEYYFLLKYSCIMFVSMLVTFSNHIFYTQAKLIFMLYLDLFHFSYF